MTGRCGILAGQGKHPLQLAEVLAKAGPAPFIICLKNQADADFSDYEHMYQAMGQIGAITKAFKDANCTSLTMAGKVVRPPLFQMKLDKTALLLLGKAGMRGDDSLLKILEAHFEAAGLAMQDPDDILPRLSLAEGYHYGCIVQNGRILAIEATEGTDALIGRSAELVDHGAGPAMLLKMMKSGQDKKLDAPGFGLQTLQHMVQSGLSVLAVEAETCRSSDSLTEIEAFAKEHQLTILALSKQFED